MATLVREVERPALLDGPAEGQLSLGAAVAAPRGGTPVSEPLERDFLSTRLRAERAAAVGAAGCTVTERGGEATLDELLVGAWEGLSARRPVACPVCSAPMHPHAGTNGGACGDCGSHLR